MTSVKIKSRCLLCDFEVEWNLDINEHGFFQISSGYCPNDFTLLSQVVDGRDIEKMFGESKKL